MDYWKDDQRVWFTIFWLSPLARVTVLFLWFTLIVGILGEKQSPEYENGREWWARLIGMLFRFTAIYLYLYAAIFVAPHLINKWLIAASSGARASAMGGGTLAAIVTALYSIKVGQFTSNLGTIRNINPELYRLPKKHLPAIASGIFLTLSLIALSCVVQFALSHASYHGVMTALWPGVVSWPSVLAVAGLGVALLCLAMLMSMPININRFSLSGTYRSRLIRAYLGASRGEQRDPDPFTGFDASDNLPLHFLRRPAEFTLSHINCAEAANLLCMMQGPFFDRARELPPLSDCAQFDRLKHYADQTVESKQKIDRELLDIFNALLRDKELYARTFAKVEKVNIDPEIQAAHEQSEAEGSVRLRNRLIIEQKFNTGHTSWVVRPFIAKPFHVINATLNLVGGQSLAWQQRKAKSFVFTPLHCGFDLGYRPASLFANGITVGSAMTVSGAAASPNMGYHSSPLLTMLMMLFNVRLGAWYGNPAYTGCTGIVGAIRDWFMRCPLIDMWPTWRLASPRLSFRSYIDEAFGRTNQDNPYVYLSDGGHFENLGGS